jgi:integrase
MLPQEEIMERKTLTDRTLKALKPAPIGKRYTVWDALLPSFGIRVTDKGSKTFIVMKRLFGKLSRWPIGTYPALSLEKARELARAYLEDIAHGIDPKSKLEAQHQAEEQKRRDTFSVVAEEFIKKHVATLRSAREVENTIRNQFIPRWGKRPVSDISRRDVLTFLEEFIDQGKKHQTHHLLAYLRKMYNWAIARDIYGIESSPCDRIKPRDLIGVLEPRKRVLHDSEIRLIWQGSQKLGYPFGTLVQLLFLTGQRLKEVAGMRWDEIDLAKNLWIIPSARMKAAADHIVPLVPETLALLESLPRWNAGKYVLSTTGGEKSISGFSRAKKVFDELLVKIIQESSPVLKGKKAKEPPSFDSWRYHDIRRTMRTNLSALPIQDIVRELVISHTQKGLHKVYDQYAYLNEKRQALELWTSSLKEILQKKIL